MINALKKKILIGRRKAIIGKIKYPLRTWMNSTALGKFGKNRVTREELLNNTKKYHTLQFGTEESIVVSEPYNGLDKLPSLISSKIGTFTLKKPFVCEVANAELVGPTAIGFDKNGNIISETVTPLDKGVKRGIPLRTWISLKLPSFGTPKLDVAFSLVNCRARRNYWHWIGDCLTRIEGLEYYQEYTGRKPVLIIDANPPTWKTESLRLLGYEPNDCIHWDRSRIEVKRLIVPSFRREQSLVSPSSCRWLRQRIFSNFPDTGIENTSFSSRIYISRSKSAGRQVINEDKLLEALNPFGFVAYTLENMSFLDQVRLFSQAEIVVSPHGAGLANMIFAQKSIIVIELFGSFVIPVYFNLAKALGFQYGCLIPSHNVRNQYSAKFDDIIVDTSKLRDLVVEMLSIC